MRDAVLVCVALGGGGIGQIEGSGGIGLTGGIDWRSWRDWVGRDAVLVRFAVVVVRRGENGEDGVGVEDGAILDRVAAVFVRRGEGGIGAGSNDNVVGAGIFATRAVEEIS